MRLLALTALAGFALISGLASTASSERAQAASCLSTRVHYEQPPNPDLLNLRLPWVSAGRPGRKIIGYLFYYGQELRKGSRLTIYAGGELPGGGSTKVLWAPRRVNSPILTISGRQLDGPGNFQQEFRSASGTPTTVYPSIVNVPEAGCWVLTVGNGPVTARFAVIALSPRP